MIYVFDLDSTLCRTLDSNYKESIPIIDRIQKVNKLFKEGHTIIIYTARGTTSGKNWFKLTKKQLNDWGISYNELILGKLHYNYWIDDKAINDKDFFK